MVEDVNCECGEREEVQIGTEQAASGLCSYCYEEKELKEMREAEEQAKYRNWEFEQSRF
jgi:hypothetical protein